MATRWRAEPDHNQLDDESVLLNFLLAVGTLGLHVPVWFLRKMPRLNPVVRHHQVNRGTAILALLAWSLGLVTGVAAESPAVTRWYPGLSAAADVLSFCLLTVALVLVLAMSFRARRILLIQLGRSSVRPARVSAVLTVLLTVLYLQYKMNRTPASGTICTCGYDLHGNISTVCPECGRPIPGHILNRLG